MAKLTSPEQLSDAIKEILDDYSDELEKNIGEVMGKVAQKGVQMLKSTSPKSKTSPHKGMYARGWKVSVENHRNLTHEAVIYNVHAGIPHLLENGHLTRNGKRTRAQTHIAPVEDTLLKEFNVEELIP